MLPTYMIVALTCTSVVAATLLVVVLVLVHRISQVPPPLAFFLDRRRKTHPEASPVAGVTLQATKHPHSHYDFKHSWRKPQLESGPLPTIQYTAPVKIAPPSPSVPDVMLAVSTGTLYGHSVLTEQSAAILTSGKIRRRAEPGRCSAVKDTNTCSLCARYGLCKLHPVPSPTPMFDSADGVKEAPNPTHAVNRLRSCAWTHTTLIPPKDPRSLLSFHNTFRTVRTIQTQMDEAYSHALRWRAVAQLGVEPSSVSSHWVSGGNTVSGSRLVTPPAIESLMALPRFVSGVLVPSSAPVIDPSRTLPRAQVTVAKSHSKVCGCAAVCGRGSGARVGPARPRDDLEMAAGALPLAWSPTLGAEPSLFTDIQTELVPFRWVASSWNNSHGVVRLTHSDSFTKCALQAPGTLTYSLLPVGSSGQPVWTRLAEYGIVIHRMNTSSSTLWSAQMASMAEVALSFSQATMEPGTFVELTRSDTLVNVRFTGLTVGTFALFITFRGEIVIPGAQVMIEIVANDVAPSKCTLVTGLSHDAWPVSRFFDSAYLMTNQVLDFILHIRDATGSLLTESRSVGYSVEPMSALLVSTVTPVISFCNQFVPVWNNSGIVTSSPMSVWRAVPAPGYVRFGDTITIGTERPQAPVMTARNCPAFRHPRGYELVWRSQKGIKQFWLWQPIPPDPLHRALGLVGTITAFEPPTHLVYTAHVSMISEIEITDPPVWTDTSELDHSILALYKIDATGMLTMSRLSHEAHMLTPSTIPVKGRTLDPNSLVRYVAPQQSLGESSPPADSAYIDATLSLPSGERVGLSLSRMYNEIPVYSLQFRLPANQVGLCVLAVQVNGMHIAGSPFTFYVHDVSPANSTISLHQLAKPNPAAAECTFGSDPASPRFQPHSAADASSLAPVPWGPVEWDDITGNALPGSISSFCVLAGVTYVARMNLRGKDGSQPRLLSSDEGLWCSTSLTMGPRVLVHGSNSHSHGIIDVMFTPLGNAPLERDFPTATLLFAPRPETGPLETLRGDSLSFVVVDSRVHSYMVAIRESMAQAESMALENLWSEARRLLPRAPKLAVLATVDDDGGLTLPPPADPKTRRLLKRTSSDKLMSVGAAVADATAQPPTKVMVELLRTHGVERPPLSLSDTHEQVPHEMITCLVSGSGTTHYAPPPTSRQLSMTHRAHGLPILLRETRGLFAKTLTSMPPIIGAVRHNRGSNGADEQGTVWSFALSGSFAVGASVAGELSARADRRRGHDDEHDGLFESVSYSSVGPPPISPKKLSRRSGSQKIRKVFLLDVSKSMQGLQTIRIDDGRVPVRRAEAARKDLIAELEALPRNAEFEVIKFGNKVVPLFHRFQSASSSHVSRARKFVRGENTSDELNSLAPNSNLYLGLETAFVHPQYNSATEVVLFTDGEPELRASGTGTPSFTYPIDVESLKAEIVSPVTLDLFFNGREVTVWVRLYSPLRESIMWMQQFVAASGSADSDVVVVGPVIESVRHPPRDYAVSTTL